MPAALRNLHRCNSNRHPRRSDDIRNIEIARYLSERAPYCVPPDINCIVVSRLSADRTCNIISLVVVKMPVYK